MLMFWLGGVIALTPILIVDAIDEGRSLEIADMIPVLLWPLGLISYLIDAARGKRP